MKFSIDRQSDLKKTFRVAAVQGKFDFQNNNIKEHFEGEINFENLEWNIGVIYGNSGTGKTTIAKELFPESYIQNFNYNNAAVVDNMPENATIDQITRTFNSVGFSSTPSWLKPYSVLSNGEKMRVDLAKAILENKSPIVFDEFTSVVDRNVAKIGSLAMAKAIRKQNKKFIAVSCHDDILEWLEPDWVFNTNTMSFFLTKNMSDQKLISQLKNQTDLSGLCLGVITI